MSSELQEIKSFVNAEGKTTIVCPRCAAASVIAASKLRTRRNAVRVKCKCGNNFRVFLEFRRHFRKKTDLQAKYTLAEDTAGIARIVNLSLGGLCFEVRGMHDLQPGQKGLISFTLDNRRQTLMEKRVMIRTVNGRFIGCEFLDDQAFQKELGFYLLP